MKISRRIPWNSEVNMFEKLVPTALVEIAEEREELISRALLSYSGMKMNKKVREGLGFVYESGDVSYLWEGERFITVSPISVEMIKGKGNDFEYIDIWNELKECKKEQLQAELF